MSFPSQQDPPREHGPDSDEEFGPYRLLEPLASGQLSRIHRARLEAQTSPSASVVIKRLQRALVRDAEKRAALLSEGQIGRRLETPHVVRVLEVHAEPEPFLVMEYVEGLSLSAIVSRARGADIARYIVPIVADALRGLEAMHALRGRHAEPTPVIHQAPCARHILVGVDGLARVIDLSHAAERGRPWSPRRDERLRAAEMAPEQELAPRHIDARCDVFIAGVALWESLTGQSLFADPSPERTLQRVLRGQVAAPSQVAPRCPPVFDRICERALQHAPWKRFASAAEMADALSELGVRYKLYAEPDELGSWLRALMAGASPEEAQASFVASRGAHAQAESLPEARRSRRARPLFPPAPQLPALPATLAAPGEVNPCALLPAPREEREPAQADPAALPSERSAEGDKAWVARFFASSPANLPAPSAPELPRSLRASEGSAQGAERWISESAESPLDAAEPAAHARSRRQLSMLGLAAALTAIGGIALGQLEWAPAKQVRPAAPAGAPFPRLVAEPPRAAPNELAGRVRVESAAFEALAPAGQPSQTDPNAPDRNLRGRAAKAAQAIPPAAPDAEIHAPVDASSKARKRARDTLPRALAPDARPSEPATDGSSLGLRRVVSEGPAFEAPSPPRPATPDTQQGFKVRHRSPSGLPDNPYQ